VLRPNAVHRESFAADQTLLAGPCEDFEVELARSGKTIFVPKDSSILEALGSNGFEVEHCCKEGVCGTCLTNVLEGEPDHRDSFLTQSERKAGDRILICVSRSKTGKLVLEL
jgi:vanillate O-demethylase ferredoxin subunit